MSVPAWYQNAVDDIGLTEGKGSLNNPIVQRMFVNTGMTNRVDGVTDDVPWCGAAVATWMAKAKIPYFKRDAARARAWLTDPNFKEIKEPVIGAVGVVPRGKSAASGHVFLFAGWVDESHTVFKAIGGNQSGGEATGHDGAVTMTRMSAKNVLGWRWPKDVPLPNAVQPYRKSGVIQGATVSGVTGGAVILAEAPALAEAVQKADSASATGTWLGIVAGTIIIAAAVWVIVSRVRAARQEKKMSA